jgi:uncharacterized protein (TIGR03067 family)
MLSLTALLCMLAVRGLTAAPDRADLGESGEMKGADSLEGTWIAVSMEFGGQVQAVPMNEEVVFTISRGKILVNSGGHREEVTYRLMDNCRPKGIDIIESKGKIGGGGRVVKGIYAIEASKLKLAFIGDGPGVERPRGFDAKEIVVMTFKRKK